MLVNLHVKNLAIIDEVEVDFSTGEIRDLTSGKSFKAQPFPEFIQDIIASGGLIEAVKQNKL